jgi:protein-L-isoaspartate(D-aspartate) O-methyltransferase
MSVSAHAVQFNESQYAQARFNMVEQQVRTWDVLDHRVLDVLHAMPRELFVNAEHRALAYADVALPVPGASQGETLFKPVIDGRILQAVALNGEEEVLEIGTGSGYTTACLAKLARQVTSIDCRNALTEAAAARLKALGLFNVTLASADAWVDFAPKYGFDVVILGGAVAQLPEIVWQWLNPNGRVFAVRGVSPAMEAMSLSGTAKLPVIKSLFETDLPYLQGAQAKPRAFVL